MEVIALRPFLSLNPEILNHKQCLDAAITRPLSCRRCVMFPMRCKVQYFCGRAIRYTSVICSISGLTDKVVSSQCEDFLVVTSTITDAKELKLSIEVSGAKTQAMFDTEFAKMVEAAQPIPGFRREKGGKTPNIPRDILLEILGPTEVYEQVIKKVIDATITEHVEKEGLKVSQDLKVEQSFEDLEAQFEPGNKFQFDVVLHLQETD